MQYTTKRTFSDYTIFPFYKFQDEIMEQECINRDIFLFISKTETILTP